MDVTNYATIVYLTSMAFPVGAVELAFISSNKPPLIFKCIYIILNYVYTKVRFNQVVCHFLQEC